MMRGRTRAPTDRERRTCGPSLNSNMPGRTGPADTGGGDLAHLPAKCEAVYPGKRTCILRCGPEGAPRRDRARGVCRLMCCRILGEGAGRVGEFSERLLAGHG